MAKLNVSLKKLEVIKQKYDLEIKSIENKLKPFVDFDFFIMYQPSDGFVVVHEEIAHNAPLGSCVDIIKRNGKLGYEDYLIECV
jgi:hypothetical protein